jgi:beta-glucosidase
MQYLKAPKRGNGSPYKIIRQDFGDQLIRIARPADQNHFRCVLLFVYFLIAIQANGQSLMNQQNIFQPLSYEEANQKADSVEKLMTLDEKIALVGGDRSFFIRPIARLGISEVYMSDATEGVHIRKSFENVDLSKYQLEKSTAFPCPIALASTWNPKLAYRYAAAIGEECRAGNIGFLLGPGMNEYRISQCGRNFEYFGEDPYLRARMIEEYVKGVQSTGTIATLKHFIANNTEFYRRKSNSIVDECALHEIYLPPFKAGIEAGARAVMTSYNQLNGEWCGQSSFVIDTLLRKELGFKWLVMTDWWSVYDGEKVATSGQDLEMPEAIALKDLHQLIENGKVNMENVDGMAKAILRTYFSMKLGERERDTSFLNRYEEHEQVALQTAREGIVLLKNSDNILPLGKHVKNILLTGKYVESLARGGGSAEVDGYDNRLMLDELKAKFGDRITYIRNPTADQIKSADVVLCNVGTEDSEGWDRPFALPDSQEVLARLCVDNNPNTVVIVTSGGGTRMTDWNDKARGAIYAWYGGQMGNKALAEIIDGETNPSGKLPITIEREFEDSPGYGYIPAGEKLYTGWIDEKDHPLYDVHYNEGIFVGYRWYEKENIEPLYPFGYGLSYTTFEYSDLKISKNQFTRDDTLTVSFAVKNTGSVQGMETAQLYVQEVECSVPRPLKELKGFFKVALDPGQSSTIIMHLTKEDFSFWDTKSNGWLAEKGKFIIHVGASSRDIQLTKQIELL